MWGQDSSGGVGGRGELFTSSSDGSTLTVAITQQIDMVTSSQLIVAFDTLLNKEQPQSLVVDLKALGFIDDFGVAVLAGMKKTVGQWQGSFTLANASAKTQALLDLHQFDTLDRLELDITKTVSPSIFMRLGDWTLNFCQDLKYMMIFMGESILSMLYLIRHPRALRGNDTIENMKRTGVDALPIVALISFLLGLIMAFMSSAQLEQFGANIMVANLVGLSMTRELGPIMTAIIVAGRSGSAYAAEIGTMKVSEEVDALYTMGMQPHIFLVMPRLIAAFWVMPALVLFSDVFGILGGIVVGVGMLDLTVSGYITQTIKALGWFDVTWGVAKGFVFAILIAWAGCLRGFQVRGGAAGVGTATTSAVVSGIFLIIFSDAILVVLLRYWG